MTKSGTSRARLVRLLGAVAVLAFAAACGVARADPPTRVARLAVATGIVALSPAGSEQWVQAPRNRPLVAGDRLWTDRAGRAELQYGSGVARVDEYTSVGIMNLDAGIAQFQLAQGTLLLRVRRLHRGEIVEVATPNLAFRATASGDYRVEVDPQGDTTTVLVREGTGDAFGDGARMRLSRGLAFRFYGSDIRNPDVWSVPALDDFDEWSSERDQAYERSATLRYVSPDVVGCAELDAYGAWQPVRGYGNVWFPRVAPDWVPYREGRWTWIEPFGWTWIDDAPWGFAPFHYGRWAYFGGRWGWIPGPATTRPVYAPALVAFLGGPNHPPGIVAGLNVGWFPLAPGEVYRPAYRASRDYVREVNVSNTIVSATVVANAYDSASVSRATYRNLQATPAAVTVVPAAVIADAEPVRAHLVPVQPDDLRRAAVSPVAAVAPVAASLVGAAPAARSQPPQDVLQRRAVATVAPAPAPQAMERRLQELRRDPGRPLPPPTSPPPSAAAPRGNGAGQAGAPTPSGPREREVATNVQVLNPQKTRAVAPGPAATTPPAAGGVRPGRERTDAAATPAPRAPSSGKSDEAPGPRHRQADEDQDGAGRGRR